MDDLVLDNPNARRSSARFLARAVADEILAPSFLMHPHVVEVGGEVVEEAKVRREGARRRNVMCGGGRRRA